MFRVQRQPRLVGILPVVPVVRVAADAADATPAKPLVPLVPPARARGVGVVVGVAKVVIKQIMLFLF